jgi:hypothetical protein
MTLAYPLTDTRTARPAAALIDAFERLGTRVRFGREAEICAPDEGAETSCRVLRGVLRTTTLTADGHSGAREWGFGGVTHELPAALPSAAQPLRKRA